MEDCIEWQFSKDGVGYGKVWIGGKLRATHRLAWEIMNGPIRENVFVCHKCDNRSCFNVNHLFLGTVADNNADTRSKGRQARGEKHGRSKLTLPQVMAIRELQGQATQKTIAAVFQISRTTVSLIQSRKKWSHA